MPGHKSSSGRQPPSAAGAPNAATPRLRPPAHDTDPSGGARGGELSRLRNPVVRRPGPPHPGSHRAAGGSRASHRACLHRQDLPSVSAAPSAHRATGRRGHWASQRLGVNVLSRIATLREEGRLPIRSVQWYLRHRAPVAPQRGGHCERHPSARRSGPNQRWLGWWTASAPAQWSTPTKPAGVKMGTTATCASP